MIAFLLENGYLNDCLDHATRRASHNPSFTENAKQNHLTRLLGQLLVGDNVTLSISHKGRVRLSELEQQLRTGRDRDESGLLWAKRHLQTDLAIELLSASNEAPMSVAFLDMNGLKAINDNHGHAAGDEAIRAFFQAVTSTLGQHGEVYRNGGDEVVVTLPRTTDERAAKLLGSRFRQTRPLCQRGAGSPPPRRRQLTFSNRERCSTATAGATLASSMTMHRFTLPMA